jgi:multidrug efflux system membrane fusion protein
VKSLRALCFSAVVAAFFASSCSGGGQQAQGPRKPGVAPVRVVRAEKKDVPLQIDGVGTMESVNNVSITSQVNGQIQKIHFKEGAFVSKGELLATLDPRPFKAALAQAEAVAKRDAVQYENAKKEAGRNAELFKKGFVSQSQYDQILANAEALSAVVNADKSAVDSAKLQLEYCYIKSPITGKTGAVMVDEGNLIKANDKAIVTILQIRPIYASFSVPQLYLPLIKKYQEKGGMVATVFPPSGLQAVKGELTFTDNTVDSTTGTIKLKATFNNPDKTLWPGQFVKVSLFLTTEKDVVAVPSQAVMTTQKGQTVYVVDKDDTASIRPVKVARTYGQDSIIEKGLEAGETVVSDGQLQTIPGGKVKVITDQPDAKAKQK